MKYVKNLTETEIILRGLTLSPGVLNIVPANAYSSWANDEIVAKKISNGEVGIFINETTMISGVLNQLSFLLDSVVDTDGAKIVRSRAFANSDGFRFRGHSFSGDVLSGETKSLDYKIEAERFINGGRLIVDNIGLEDKITFQVVDKDNVIGYGAGVVLDEFIEDYFIPNEGNLEVRLDYPAKIPAGLYLRLKYTSTHASGCKVKCNLYLHWKAA
jgi:hypothetical protein